MPWLNPGANPPDLAELFVLPQVANNGALLEPDLAGACTVGDQKGKFTVGIAAESAGFGKVARQCLQDGGFYTPVLVGLPEKPVERAFRATIEWMSGSVFPGHGCYLQFRKTLKL